MPTARSYFQCCFPVKEPDVLGEMAGSTIKAGNIRDGISCSARKYESAFKKRRFTVMETKGLRSQPERALSGQSWNSLSKKKIIIWY